MPSRKPFLHRQLLHLRWMLLRHYRLARILAVASLFLLFFLIPHSPSSSDVEGEDRDYVRDALALPAETYPPPEMLARFMREATQYLIRANYVGNQGRGSFFYRPEIRDDGGLHEGIGYNTLRHAGALYALSSICVGVKADYCKGAEDAIKRGGEWLLRRTVERINGTKLFAVWSRSEIETPWKKKEHKEVRLGGCGLGLVAMTEAYKLGANIPLEVLDGIGRFVLEVMRKKEGGYWSYFRNGMVDTENEMMYFPGEAALGLIRLYRVTGNDKYLQGAVDSLRERARKKTVLCDHWYLVATSEGWDDDWGDDREEIREHGMKVKQACYKREYDRSRGTGIRSASFATSVEAMMGGMILGWDKEVYCQAGRSVGMIIACQYSGERQILRGAVVGGAEVGKGEGRAIEWTDGKFQVDYTQHSLSAVLGLVKNGKGVVCDRGGEPWIVRDDWQEDPEDER